MKKIYQIIAMAILILGISACQKDKLDISGDVKLPEDIDVTKLERWSYEIPFTISSNSEWKIDIEGEFCYTDISEGSGSATVQLCIIDNPTEKRQAGSLTVIFPKDPSKNYTLNLQQKCSADYDDNADEITVGNRVYAIGYGYNISGEYASPNSVRNAQIVRFNDAQKDNLIHFGPVTASFEAKTYSGSSITEISNQLNANANFGGGVFGFSGEIGATFDMKSFNNNNNEYAISYVEVALKDAVIEAGIVTIREDYLTPQAYRAINGINKRGEPSVTYPTSNEGFSALLKEYGTHLIIKSRLGGKMKYSLMTDVSKVEGEYNLTAFANARYKNKYVHTSASVSDTYKNSYKKNSSACTERLQIIGGDTQMAVNLSNGDTDANVTAWKNSLVDGKNLALVGLDLENGLIPLYELVDVEEYPERAAAFKAYMTGESIKEVVKPIEMIYKCGTISHIEVPKFNPKGSLVKLVYAGGQQVAQICEEFIPVISTTKRVTVIYPVISNKVKLNMGYFIGDETHRPARICWQGGNLSVEELSDSQIGRQEQLYTRGASFMSKTSDESVKTSTQDQYLSAYNHQGILYKYPIVKIFNNYWLKENYSASKSLDGWNIENRMWNSEVFESFYAFSDIKDETLAKSGWIMPLSSDYNEIINSLRTLQNFEVGPAFNVGGVLGFDAPRTGFYGPNALPSKNSQSEYWTSDGSHFRVQSTSVAVEGTGHNPANRFSIRWMKKTEEAPEK